MKFKAEIELTKIEVKAIAAFYSKLDVALQQHIANVIGISIPKIDIGDKILMSLGQQITKSEHIDIAQGSYLDVGYTASGKGVNVTYEFDVSDAIVSSTIEFYLELIKVILNFASSTFRNFKIAEAEVKGLVRHYSQELA